MSACMEMNSTEILGLAIPSQFKRFFVLVRIMAKKKVAKWDFAFTALSDFRLRFNFCDCLVRAILSTKYDLLYG